MSSSAAESVTGPRLSPDEFEAFRDLILRTSGISMGDGKHVLVASRLRRRLRTLGLESYSDYFDYVRSRPDELEPLINCVTTNKTSFFREEHHFEYLASTLIPQLVERARRTGDRRVRIWSAACSTGEEPYSIAMTLLQHLPDPASWDVRILASDIDTDVLARAEAGVYTSEIAASIPEQMRKRYTTRDRDGSVRMGKDIRALITFRSINLITATWPIRTKFDAIFCRNVVIYFDHDTKDKLFKHFANYIEDDGILVLGHSESLHWLPQIYGRGANTIYDLAPSYVARRGGHREVNPAREPADIRPASTVPTLMTAPRVTKRITVGDVFASSTPAVVRTLLGSCVAACLYDPTARVGGMNHFLLPAGSADEPASARFGVHAMELLINAIMQQGGDRRRLEAKVFGGAHVLGRDFSTAVPVKNVEFIRGFLATERIPVRGELLGGDAPFDVCMFTESGRVLARRLDVALAHQIVDAETRFRRDHAETPATPDSVTLF